MCGGRICFLLAEIETVLASRPEAVLLSLLCPWLKGDGLLQLESNPACFVLQEGRS